MVFTHLCMISCLPGALAGILTAPVWALPIHTFARYIGEQKLLHIPSLSILMAHGVAHGSWEEKKKENGRTREGGVWGSGMH